LISNNGKTTATGLSATTDNEVSHDQIIRFLSKNEFGSKELWKQVKKMVKEVVSFQIIEKYQYSDIETKIVKRKAAKTKNELMREMVLTTVKNQVKFKYVLMDTWFGAKENFKLITKYKKEFISAIKSNRLIALYSLFSNLNL